MHVAAQVAAVSVNLMKFTLTAAGGQIKLFQTAS